MDFGTDFPAASPASTLDLAWVRECLAFGNKPETVARELVHSLQHEEIGAYRKLAGELFEAQFHDIAVVVLSDGLSRWSGNPGLCFDLGNALRMLGHIPAAQALYRAALQAQPDYREAMLGLAYLLRDSGDLEAAAHLVYDFGTRYPQPLDFSLGSIDFLTDCRRHRLAARYCQHQLSQGVNDPRLLVRAGRTAQILGDFDSARTHLTAAMATPIAGEAMLEVPLFLANSQRYADPQHPDLSLFRKIWESAESTDESRLVAGFALGKALDDLQRHGEAATVLRRCNALAAQRRSWSVDTWNSFVEQQIQAPAAPITRVPLPREPVPIFIVGLPRTGTTLAAEILGRHPDVRNRGELNWMQFLHERISAGQIPDDQQGLEAASAVFLRQANGSDSPPPFFVDKNPLNFRYLGLIAKLFPNARIVHCVRHRRDTALSIWSQHFPDENGNYSHTFGNIAAFAAGHDRLMRHWSESLALPMFTLHYESAVQQPDAEFVELQRFVGLSPQDLVGATGRPGGGITTASAWQARQPIYRSSENRWRAYAPYLPELMQLFPEAT